MGRGTACPISHLGNPEILNRSKIALVCSVRCPGSVILQTYDLMKSLRNENVTVISGFHSPMERECLKILLRGSCGIVLCLARSLPKRTPSEYRKPIEEGRMLILSPFDDNQTRATKKSSAQRNRLVADMGNIVFVPYAAEGGKTEALCGEFLKLGKRAVTFGGDRSARLLDAGATAVDTAEELLLICRKERSV